jgi:hypothetical protein
MSAANVIDTIHWSVAFLILLSALLLGWVQLGRRVMVALIGLQVLIGIVYAAVLGAALATKGAILGVHIVGALLAMAAYMVGRRLGERGGSRFVPLALSAVGLIVLFATAYLGLKMYGRV